MTELTQFGAVALMAFIAFGTFRVVADLLKTGTGRIREVREEGGGLIQKLRGELDGGQSGESSARAHGLHIAVTRGGEIEWREKSAIAKEVA